MKINHDSIACFCQRIRRIVQGKIKKRTKKQKQIFLGDGFPYLSGAEVEALAGVSSSDECRVETHGHVRPPHGNSLVTDVSAVSAIGAKPNIHCKAIELVCGGSPKACVLVEWKALDRVKSEI